MGVYDGTHKKFILGKGIKGKRVSLSRTKQQAIKSENDEEANIVSLGRNNCVEKTDTGSRKRKYRSKQSKIKINLDISHQQNLRYKNPNIKVNNRRESGMQQSKSKGCLLSPISNYAKGSPIRTKTGKGCFSDNTSTPMSKFNNNEFNSTEELVCVK